MKQENVKPSPDPFFAGNETIEEAIERFFNDKNQKTLIDVLESIRKRMREDGHFIFPTDVDEDGKTFHLKGVKTDDGGFLQIAFTSRKEYEKGESGEAISNFIDTTMKACAEQDTDGIMLNPWSQPFILTNELIDMIFRADEKWKEEHPDRKYRPEELEDGSVLKEAVHKFLASQTRSNYREVLRLLHDSLVWIPCNAVLSDEDSAAIEKQIKDAEKAGNFDSMIGKELEHKDAVRMVPDILSSGDEYFFPVFTGIEEMGEYGESFSKVQRHFREAMVLAKNNKKKVSGIVINAFSEPFVLRPEMFETVDNEESVLKAE